MHHWREQVRIQRWMTEALLETMALVIRIGGMHVSLAHAVVGWQVPAELLVELPSKPELEDSDKENRRQSRGPDPMEEAKAQDDG